jgi:hypothetical protein
MWYFGSDTSRAILSENVLNSFLLNRIPFGTGSV